MRQASIAAPLLLTHLLQVPGLQFKDAVQDADPIVALARQGLREEFCQKVAYISIPGTASSTLAEGIIPAMTKKYGQTQVSPLHIEYNWAKALAPQCMVASLRDPVERFMSEFSEFRGWEGQYSLEQDQWDIHTQDLPWARNVRALQNSTLALNEYMTSPANPTRNRQALYLLGFERVQCEERCCGACSRGAPGYPAQAYDWSAQHDELLAKAKKHLSMLNAFVVQDCFEESMRTVANALGWDEEETADLATSTHIRARRNAMGLSRMASGLGSGKVKLQRVLANVTQDVKWASTLPPGMAESIRRQNALDVELVAFAKQLLHQRHGIECDGEDYE